MGFYAPHVVVSDALRSGVKFLPVDVRHSQARTTVEGDAIRLGLDYLNGFGEETIQLLLDERQRRPFRNLADLVKRTGLDRPRVEALVQAGALDYLGERRQLLWDIAEAFRLAKRPATRPRPAESGVASSEWGPRELPLSSPDEQVKLPPMDRHTRLSTAFAFTGVSLDGHLTELRRDAFTRAGARSISELSHLKHGQRVKVGGLIVTLQRPPTAKGVAFLALEDPTGLVNVVIAPPVYAQYREAIHATFVIVEGVVQQDHGAINVVAKEVHAV
jgi:error-prone DNA polymerase